MSDNLQTLDELFKKPVNFSYQIEVYRRDNKCAGYVDAILKFCTENSIDYEDVVSLISPNMKEKIAEEAEMYGVMLSGLAKPMIRQE